MLEVQPLFSMTGVPQASNLGPLLFLIFINDLSVELVTWKLLLFADDVNLYYVISSNSDSELLQAKLSGLQAWSLKNGLPFNPGKCKVISFSQGVRKFSQPYILLDNELERVAKIRDLGVVLDSSLNFEQLLRVVVNKCLRLFGFMRNITPDFTNPYTITHLYEMLVLPILTYCITLWCLKIKIALMELIAIEHKFLRYASSKTTNPMHYFDHDYTQIRALLKIESFRSQIMKIDFLVAFKIAHKLYRSEEVNNLFVKRTLKHNLRCYREFANDKAKPNYLDNSVSFRLREIWNKLPGEVRNIERLNVFKRSLGEIIENIEL